MNKPVQLQWEFILRSRSMKIPAKLLRKEKLSTCKGICISTNCFYIYSGGKGAKCCCGFYLLAFLSRNTFLNRCPLKVS